MGRLLSRGTRTRRLRGRRILRAAQQASLLSQSALRDKLLPLQFLDAVLQLGNLGFVDFEGRRGGSGGRSGPRGLGLFAARQPHDRDHQEREAREKPGLYVLGQKTFGLGRFVLHLRRLDHRSGLSSSVCRVKVNFFLPTAR